MASRAAVVVVLLILAGCGAFGGPDRQTVTPAPVPEQSQGDGLAPGVSADGVDARRLGAAHRRATRNRSYALAMRVSMEWGTQVVSLAVETSRRYEYRTEIIDQQYTRRVYTDGSRRYTRNERAQGTWTTTGEPAPVSAMLDPDPARLVEAYLDTDVRVAEPQSDCGSCPVTLTARDPPPAFEPADNFSVRAAVRPDGLVTSLSVSYWDRSSDSHVEYEIRYTDIGTTTVSRPAWVRSDPANATDSDTALSDTA